MVSFGSALYHWKPNNWLLVWDRLPMAVGFMSIFCLFDRKDTSTYIYGYVATGVASCIIWCISLFFNYDSSFKWNWNTIGNQSKDGILDMMSCIETRKWQKTLEGKYHRPVMSDSTSMTSNNLMKTVNSKKQRKKNINIHKEQIWGSDKARNFIPRDLLLPYILTQYYPLGVMLYIMMTQWNNIAHPVGCLVLFLSYMVAKLVESIDMKFSSSRTGLHILKQSGNRFSGHTLKHIAAGLGPLYLIYDMVVNS